MRLVMKYTFGDGCTYSCDATYPIVSESLEQALCDFEDAYKEAKAKNASFVFAGDEFYAYDFECEGKYYAPDFITLDEWFAALEG